MGRAQGFHDDTGDLGLDGNFQPRMMGTDGGVFAPLEVRFHGQCRNLAELPRSQAAV